MNYRNDDNQDDPRTTRQHASNVNTNTNINIDNENENEKEHENECKSESDNEEGSKPTTRKRRISTRIKNQTRKNNKRSSKTEESTKTTKRQKASTNENSHKNNDATSTKQKKQDDELYQSTIAEIPMGSEAAKMMTTFGDGSRPDPEALKLALMGTRRALQISIMDARKVRRRLQADYREAQSVLTVKYDKRKMNKPPPTVAAAREWVAEQQQQQQQQQQQPSGDGDEPCTPTKASAASLSLSSPPSTKSNSAKKVTATANSIDPKLLYRVLAEGTDKLSYSHKCGFHMEELTHLYPEEMRAFRRCHEMYEDFNESKDVDAKEDEANGENDNGDSKAAGKTSNTNNANGDNEGDDDNNKTDDDDDVDGGHLRERAANFDFRTDQMKNDWYVEYSKVRLGSFLPSKSTSTTSTTITKKNKQYRSSLEREWDKLRKVGRHARGEWENLNAKAVRFLHWLGFDPPNLYPPDEETTQALAFLAYDRLGRIVEKAICLRNETDPRARSLCELPPGNQLSKEDVTRALKDPDVKPATVYYYDETTTNTTGEVGGNGGKLASSSVARCGDAPSSFLSSHSIQLYFGPGWEDRLELEMEEMIASAKGGANHRLTEEERMVRNHELELLARISKPPEKEGVLLEALVQKHREQQQESKRQQEADKAEDEEEGH
mmetsp:Transcript_32816/g.77395  ORF Transcript_32816/g.77395 Transcript_32816/m.77395 type:complete len:665 (-) Transcript_32816:3932-5926(-)